MSWNPNVEFLFQPSPKQIAFFASPKKFRQFMGGMGSGKTTAGVWESIQQGLSFAGNQILIGRATYPELRDTTRKEFLQFPVIVDGKQYEFGSSPLVTKLNLSENYCRLWNNTEYYFRALADSFDKVKSMNLGFYWIDEDSETPEDIWLALEGRLRLVLPCPVCRKRPGKRRVGGKLVQATTCDICKINGRPLRVIQHGGIGTTNPEGHDWIWKRFIAGAERKNIVVHETPYGPIETFTAEKEDSFVVTVTSEENPGLPEGYVEGMKRNYPEEWVKRYVYGSCDTFSGLIYHEWKDEKPLVVDRFEVPPSWYRFIALDYGYRNPTAALWFAVSPKGKAYVYDEFYASGKLVSETCEIIKAKNGGQRIQMYLGDPSMRNTTGVSGRSILDEFADNGIFIQPANNSVSAGINRVKERFREKSLIIFRDCTNLRTELQTYKWKDLKPGAVQDGPEKPVKKDDHAVDALRYGTVYLYETPAVKEKPYAFDYTRSVNENEPSHWMAA